MNLTEFLDKNKYIIVGVVVVIVAIIIFSVYSKKEHFVDVSLEKSRVVIAKPDDILSHIIPEHVIAHVKDVKPESLDKIKQALVSRRQVIESVIPSKVIMPISSESSELSHKVLVDTLDVKPDVVIEHVVARIKDLKPEAIPTIKNAIVLPSDIKPGLVPSHSIVAHPAPVAVIAKPEDAKPSHDNLVIVKASEVKDLIKPFQLVVDPKEAMVATHIIAPAVHEKSELANKVIANIKDVKLSSPRDVHVVVKMGDVKPETEIKHVIVMPHEAVKPTHVIIHNPAIIAPHTIMVKPEDVLKPKPYHHLIVRRDEVKPEVRIRALVAKPSDVKDGVVAENVLVPLSRDTGRIPEHSVIVPPSDLKHDSRATHAVILPHEMKDNVIPHRVIVPTHEVSARVIPCHSLVTLSEHPNALRMHPDNDLSKHELGPRPVGSRY